MTSDAMTHCGQKNCGSKNVRKIFTITLGVQSDTDEKKNLCFLYIKASTQEIFEKKNKIILNQMRYTGVMKKAVKNISPLIKILPQELHKNAAY